MLSMSHSAPKTIPTRNAALLCKTPTNNQLWPCNQHAALFIFRLVFTAFSIMLYPVIYAVLFRVASQ
jgi:hypothetical protein